MSISSLYVRNFKGIEDAGWIPLRPVTLFIGANSSGKSSCIHALASLSQTVKLPNNQRPLILDDEYASVHLGRFIEVIHSKSYSDSIGLGIEIPEVMYFTGLPAGNKPPKSRQDVGTAQLEFSCSKRTQDIHLDAGTYRLGDLTFHARRAGEHYIVSVQGQDSKETFLPRGGLLIEPDYRKRVTDLDLFFALDQFQRAIEWELSRTIYLGPFRQPPLRRYPTRGSSPTEVGSQGEATTTLLANEVIQKRTRPHIKQIASWLQIMGLGSALEVERVGRSDLFDVTVTLKDGASFPIADLGYGLSQVLPVLTQCSFAEEGSTLLFEQPELHLHTLAAKPLAKVFIDTARKKKARIVAETHSPDLFRQFVRELDQGTIGLDELAAYKVHRVAGASKVSLIEIDPEDFEVYERWETDLVGR